EPQTCAEIRAAHPSAADGVYTIYPASTSGQGFSVYCAGMATAPAEYLRLVNTGGGFNYSNMHGGGSIAPGDLTTSWTELRLDPATLVVNTGDYTFSTSSGT